MILCKVYNGNDLVGVYPEGRPGRISPDNATSVIGMMGCAREFFRSFFPHSTIKAVVTDLKRKEVFSK